MERLGTSFEFGELWLTLLRNGGWKPVAVMSAFGGGWLVIASKNNAEVAREAATFGEAAFAVFEEATRQQRLGLDEPLQLRLA